MKWNLCLPPPLFKVPWLDALVPRNMGYPRFLKMFNHLIGFIVPCSFWFPRVRSMLLFFMYRTEEWPMSLLKSFCVISHLTDSVVHSLWEWSYESCFFTSVRNCSSGFIIMNRCKWSRQQIPAAPCVLGWFRTKQPVHSRRCLSMHLWSQVYAPNRYCSVVTDLISLVNGA